MSEIIKIREWTERDTGKVKEIHDAMALGYQFPNISSPLFFQKAVAEENGKISGAAAIRLIGEAFLWLADGSKIRKGRVLSSIYPIIGGKAKENGLEDVSAWIPPQIEPDFSEALHGIGFVPSPWPCWSMKL